VDRKAGKSHRRSAKPTARDQSDQTMLPLQPRDRTTVARLPMEIQVGDRFTAEGFEWEVVSHPGALHGGKTLRPRGSTTWSTGERTGDHVAGSCESRDSARSHTVSTHDMSTFRTS
jgi:hypothetical protein